jgi:predicted TPR repeat methyltransferase
MTTIDMHLFTKDYYEDGVRKHISGYENYSWQPTRSIPEALDIQNYFDFDTCVDYGCAKGFLVHALRILGSKAYGEDMSEYAIENCHPAVKDYLSLPNKKIYDLLICKDMLEHVEEVDIPAVLHLFKQKSDQFFFTIPLGDNDRFRIREYEVDITHVTKKDEEWWIKTFEKHGFELIKFCYEFGSIKRKWVDKFPYGNGFFILKHDDSYDG